MKQKLTFIVLLVALVSCASLIYRLRAQPQQRQSLSQTTKLANPYTIGYHLEITDGSGTPLTKSDKVVAFDSHGRLYSAELRYKNVTDSDPSFIFYKLADYSSHLMRMVYWSRDRELLGTPLLAEKRPAGKLLSMTADNQCIVSPAVQQVISKEQHKLTSALTVLAFQIHSTFADTETGGEGTVWRFADPNYNCLDLDYRTTSISPAEEANQTVTSFLEGEPSATLYDKFDADFSAAKLGNNGSINDAMAAWQLDAASVTLTRNK